MHGHALKLLTLHQSSQQFTLEGSIPDRNEMGRHRNDLSVALQERAWQDKKEESGGQAEADHHTGWSAWAGKDLSLQQDHVLPQLVSAALP